MGSCSVGATRVAPSSVTDAVGASESAISTLRQFSDCDGCVRSIGSSGVDSRGVVTGRVLCSVAGVEDDGRFTVVVLSVFSWVCVPVEGGGLEGMREVSAVDPLECWLGQLGWAA